MERSIQRKTFDRPAGLAEWLRLARQRQLAPRPVFRRAVERVAAEAAEPEIRYRAQLMLAELAVGRGELQDARGRLEALGILLDGWAVAAGGSRGSLFVPLALPPPDGLLPLDALAGAHDAEPLRLRRWVYAPEPRLVAVVVEDARRVPLEGVEVRVNDRLVESASEEGAAHGLVGLRAGFNRLTITLKRPAGSAWAARVRLVDRHARPIRTEAAPGAPPQADEVAPVAETGSGSGTRTGALGRAPNTSSAVSWWQRQPRSAQRTQVLRELGRAEADLASSVEPGADGTEALKPDERLEHARAATRSHLALNLLRPLVESEGRVPSALRAAALREVARRRRDRGQLIVGLDAIREARSISGQDGPEAGVLEAELLADLQQLGIAQGLLLELDSRYPETPIVVGALASVFQQRQLSEQALEHYERLAALDAGDGEPLVHAAELAAGLGRTRQALGHVARLVERYPGVPGHRLLAVRLALDAGRGGLARTSADAALAAFPYEADLAASLAEVFLDEGDDARGIALARRALRLRPHQPDLRRRLAGRAPVAVATQAYALDLEQVVHDAPVASATGPAAEYLETQRLTRLYEDGTSETRIQHVMRINRASVAAPNGRSWTVGYDPTRQAVTVLAARRYRAGGAVVDDAEQLDHEVGEAWYGLYYEQRAVKLHFGSVEDGDVFVVDYRVSDFGRSLYGGVYGEIAPVQSSVPVNHARIVFVVPSTSTFQAARYGPGLTAMAPTLNRVDGGDRHVVFDVRDMPAVAIEQGMPGYTEVGQFVHGSTFDTPEAVARWYYDFISPQLRPGPMVKARAQALKRSTTAGTVAAVHDFVTRKVRYVGLEFGEHGYKPYPVDAVFERRFGDCKDKSSLMHTLLAEVGIDSHIVLVRTRKHGRLPSEAISLGAFDHAIVHVPALDAWIDPTAAFFAVGELPEQNQGATALLIDPDGGRLVTIPVSAADNNRILRTLDFRAYASGRTEIRGNVEAAGVMAPPIREQLAVPAQRLQAAGELVAAAVPGALVRSVDADVALGGPARYSFDAALERTPDSPIVVFPSEWSLRRGLAPDAVRRQPLVIAHPLDWEWHVRVIAEPDVSLNTQEWFDELTTPFGRVSARVRRVIDEDGKSTVVLRLRVVVAAARVQPDQYPAFRRFTDAADALIARLRLVEVQTASGHHD